MIYKLPGYVPGIAFALALLAVAIGVLLLRRRRPLILALIPFGFALFAGALIGPMLLLDRVVLDDEKLEQTTGFWFAPTVKGFRLTEVESITITTARDRNNREYDLWTARTKNGAAKQVDPGDLWEMNTEDIVERLRAMGITVNQ